MVELTVAKAIDELIPLLQNKQLNAFVGSGISKGSGLPLWKGLLQNFVDFFEKITREVYGKLPLPPDLDNLIHDARKRIDADKGYIEVATTLRNRLLDLGDEKSIQLDRHFKQWLANQFPNNKPNELHKKIVKTDFPYILTTNYDQLLEAACDESGLSLIRDITPIIYTDPAYLAEAIFNRKSAIIYVHGRTDSIPLENFVFSAQDYAKMINKHHYMFALALRTLFFSHSTLFLGYGGVDPHVESLIDELTLSVVSDQKSKLQLPNQYEVIHKDDVDQVLKQYKRLKRTKLIILDNYSDYDTLLEALQKASPRLTSL